MESVMGLSIFSELRAFCLQHAEVWLRGTWLVASHVSAIEFYWALVIPLKSAHKTSGHVFWHIDNHDNNMFRFIREPKTACHAIIKKDVEKRRKGVGSCLLNICFSVLVNEVVWKGGWGWQSKGSFHIRKPSCGNNETNWSSLVCVIGKFVFRLQKSFFTDLLWRGIATAFVLANTTRRASWANEFEIYLWFAWLALVKSRSLGDTWSFLRQSCAHKISFVISLRFSKLLTDSAQ